MDSLESWLDFVRGERITPSTPKTCDECRGLCDGDITIHAGGEAVGYLCARCYAAEPVVRLEDVECGENLLSGS